MIKNTIYGNWKMNQSVGEIQEFLATLSTQKLNCVFGIAPQAMHLQLLKDANIENFKTGSQTCSENDNGAFTGELSCSSLSDMNIDFTLIGHSERRAIFKESNQQINAKVKKALAHNLEVVLCIGETLEQRNAGETLNIVKNQLAQGLKDITYSNRILIAYEPVWAIGTGVTATPQQAGEVHQFIRKYLTECFGDLGVSTPLLYGGSVKPNNIKDLLAQTDINGALVGGASIKADSFTELCNKAGQSS